MTLQEYRSEVDMCCRCSACKFIPLERVEDAKFSYCCPSIARYGFHAYSGGGRLAVITAILEGRLAYTDKLLDLVYSCQMCGACDISCKYAMDMEILEPLNELRIKCVEDGHTVPSIDNIINNLRNQHTMVSNPMIKRGDWCRGLDIKDYTNQQTQVIYHAGCRTSLNKSMWKNATSTVSLLRKAGVDFGVAADDEPCCGGRAYEMGYKADFLKQAESAMGMFKKSGATTLVTGCAECYHAFKVLYDKFNLSNGEIEIVHISEYLTRLIKGGKLKPDKEIKTKVTFHDPCHLGRLGEPYIHWKGQPVPGHIRLFNPVKEFRRGTYGVYEPPRLVLQSIPGLTLLEMKRRKEYAWCCGAGGGMGDGNPEFARWTAQQRITEAESTGAEAIVTACPGCEEIFTDTIKTSGSKLKTYDIVAMMAQSI